MRHGGRKPRTRHVRFFVAQPVSTLPRAPPSERLTQIGDAFLDGSSVFLVHHSQTLDGNLAGLGQVTIHRCQRVQRRLVVEGFDTRQTCRLAVACLCIVVVQPLPRIQRPSYHVQQVVAIVRLAVLALDDKGLIAFGLHLCQRLGVQHGLLTVFCRLVSRLLAQRATVVLVDLRQHGMIHGLQRHVLRRLGFLFQSHDGRLQRVGGYPRLLTGIRQRGPQQLSVGTFFLRLRLYLLQVLHRGLGQVLVQGLFHLFPQVLVCLTEYSHGH